MPSGILKSFLVQLGFKVDDQAARAFHGHLTSATLAARLLGDTLEGMARRMTGAIRKVTSDLTDLYYMSQRTKVAAENIRAFQYAAVQMGSSVEQANSTLENFARSMRETAGYGSFVEKMTGVKVAGQDPAVALSNVIAKLSTLQYNIAKVRADAIGIDPDQFAQMYGHAQEMRRNQDEYLRKQRTIGVDLQEAAKGSVELSRALYSMGTSFSLIMDKVIGGMSGELGANFQRLIKLIDENGPEIAKSLTIIAQAILDIFTNIVKWLSNSSDVKKTLQDVAAAFVAIGHAITNIASAINWVAGAVGGWGNLLTAFAGVFLLSWVGKVLSIFRGLTAGIGAIFLRAGLGGAAGAAGGMSAFGAGLLAMAAGALGIDAYNNTIKSTAADDTMDAYRKTHPGYGGGGGGGGGGAHVQDRVTAAGAGNSGPVPSIDGSGLDWSKMGTQTNSKRAFLISKLVGMGLSPEAAAGMVGNAEAESNFKINAYNPRLENSHGLFQWNDSPAANYRWTKYQNWARENGQDIYDPSSQLAYAKVEASGMRGPSGKSVWDAMLGARSAREASDIWMNYFERPTVRDSGNRGGLAERALSAYQRALAGAGGGAGIGAPSSMRAGSIIAIGDSLAAGLNLPGDAVVSRPPSGRFAPGNGGVLEAIQRQGDLHGKHVILSTGMSNRPDMDLSVVGQQIDEIRNRGGTVTVLGVGPKFGALNDRLQRYAIGKGAHFMGLGNQFAGDQVHPTGAGYATLRRGILGAGNAVTAAASARDHKDLFNKPTLAHGPTIGNMQEARDALAMHNYAVSMAGLSQKSQDEILGKLEPEARQKLLESMSRLAVGGNPSNTLRRGGPLTHGRQPVQYVPKSADSPQASTTINHYEVGPDLQPRAVVQAIGAHWHKPSLALHTRSTAGKVGIA